MNVREEMAWLYGEHKRDLKAGAKAPGNPQARLTLLSDMADLLVAMANYDAAQELAIQVQLELEEPEAEPEAYADWSEDDEELPGEFPLEPSELDR